MPRASSESDSKIYKFSIIVPLYNKKAYIADCLAQIKSQTEEEWECVIVNDGSTDGGEKIAEQYALEDQRFKVINQKNLGPSAARNRGIGEARGKLLHFMDADDRYPARGTLEAVWKEYLVHRPSAIAGNIGILSAGSDKIHYDVDVNADTSKLITFRELQNDYFFTRFFFDRMFIKDNLITFPENTRVGEDPVFLVRALSLMNQFLVTNLPVYVYNQAASSNNAFYEYDDEKILSYLNTQIEILKVCEENDYKILTKRILNRIDAEMFGTYLDRSQAGSADISAALRKLLSFVYPELHYERINALRKKDIYIKELEHRIAQTSSVGVKAAAKLLVRAVRVKIYKDLRRTNNE
jgi:glycosyltransferase involved in cell wall biosynthesis